MQRVTPTPLNEGGVRIPSDRRAQGTAKQGRRLSVSAHSYHRQMSKGTTKAGPAVSAPSNTLPHDIGEPASQVLRRFRLVFNAVKTHFQQVEKKTGIGGAQLWALSIIRARPDLRMNDLAQSMDVHPSTASNLVRALIERELVVANKHGPDRRTVHISILPAGETVLRKAPGPLAGVLPQALASLDARTLTRLDTDLAKLIAGLDADERGANIPLGQ